MIENERQYQITKIQARRFAESVRAVEEGRADKISPGPMMANAQKEALMSQLADLESELREYESLKR